MVKFASAVVTVSTTGITLGRVAVPDRDSSVRLNAIVMCHVSQRGYQIVVEG